MSQALTIPLITQKKRETGSPPELHVACTMTYKQQRFAVNLFRETDKLSVILIICWKFICQILKVLNKYFQDFKDKQRENVQFMKEN